MNSKALSLRAAADRVGLHHSTLRAMIDDGEGPPAFIKHWNGRTIIRIQPADLERWRRHYTRGRVA